MWKVPEGKYPGKVYVWKLPIPDSTEGPYTRRNLRSAYRDELVVSFATLNSITRRLAFSSEESFLMTCALFRWILCLYLLKADIVLFHLYRRSHQPYYMWLSVDLVGARSGQAVILSLPQRIESHKTET